MRKSHALLPFFGVSSEQKNVEVPFELIIESPEQVRHLLEHPLKILSTLRSLQENRGEFGDELVARFLEKKDVAKTVERTFSPADRLSLRSLARRLNPEKQNRISDVLAVCQPIERTAAAHTRAVSVAQGPA